MTTTTPPATDRNLVWKISAGALIPAIATVIFNILNFFFENHQANPMPRLSHSVFDIGVGCSFSMVGVCVASKDHAFTRTFLVVFVFLLLIILGGQLLVLFRQWNGFTTVWITNLICLTALTWAIIEAE